MADIITLTLIRTWTLAFGMKPWTGLKNADLQGLREFKFLWTSCRQIQSPEQMNPVFYMKEINV